jgi:hypothetical protein
MEPFVTIAGQTAPGDGILIRNAGLYIDTHDVIVRNIRVRIGASLVEEYDTQDPLHIEGEGCHDIVVDHCSFSWSIDEAVGISAGAHDITMSWSIIGWPLNQPFTKEQIGKKREHAYGVILGNHPNHVTLHHNLIANAQHRSPRIQGGTHEFSNNLVYNWGYFAGVFSRNPNVNFIANYYKAGPDSRIVPPICDKPGEIGKVYIRKNISPLRSADHLPDAFWSTCVDPEAEARAEEPFPTAPLHYTSAVNAYIDVLAGAGCRVPALDFVDYCILSDVVNGTGEIIDRPEDVGGFPEIKGGEPPKDSDNDGMPDEWETQHGLNPRNPHDGNEDGNGDGYTNLEEYLNGLAEICIQSKRNENW